MKNNPQDTAQDFGQHANLYVEKYFDVDFYQDALKVFYKISNAHVNYLDIAYRPGNLTSRLLSQFPNTKVLGIDIADEMLVQAKKNNPTAKFKNISCSALASIEVSFDGILCGFVLPYLNKAETKELIHDVPEKLNTSGTLFLSGNLGEYKKSILRGPSSDKGPELYSFNYSKSFLENELSRNGFSVQNTFEYQRQYDKFSTNEIALVAIKT